MKPRVFIGSSGEGKEKAVFIKEQLREIAEYQIRDEGFFENNKSSFESLAEGSTLFDFAILVATIDDVQLKRDSLELIPRENIIFEFGFVCVKTRKKSFLFL